jgi:DnaJ-class molecular chaperone
MAWLARLLGREQLNPEEYERARCDECDGKGVLLSLSHGTYEGHVETRTCWKCHGKGYLIVKRAE